MKTLLTATVLTLAAWMAWTEYRISGLEIRLNLQEASQHWQEEPPK